MAIREQTRVVESAEEIMKAFISSHHNFPEHSIVICAIMEALKDEALKLQCIEKKKNIYIWV